MVFNLWYLLYATITYAVIAWLRAHLAERRFQRWAKEQGAEPAHRATALKLPYGIDGIITATWKIMSGADIMDDLVVPRMQNLRATTLEIKVPNLVSNDYLVETFEPKNVQAVLATKFEDFEIGEKRHRAFRVLLGKSIFTSDGEFWAHSRALFRPVFNRESINDLEETDRAAKILIDLVSQNEGPNGWTPEVNLMDHFFRFTLDTSTAFLFGENAGSQLGAAGKLEDGATFDPNLTETFKVAQEWLQWRMVAGSFYWMITTAKWRRAAKAVLDFVDHYVQLALKRKKDEDEGKGGSSGRYNLLSELATRCHDPLELRDQILAMLGAGRDTTASLLSWLWVELALNPTVYAKLREEVLSTFPESPDQILSFAQLKSCKYLQYTINETLRLHPPVPVNSRQASRDTTLPHGGGRDGNAPLAIRKGQLVAYDVYPMQRRKDIWGDDANEFNPERWAGRKIDWSFVPFSGGPRICLGQQYAMTEASYLTVRLVQAFDEVEWARESRKVGKGFTLTMCPLEGTPVRLRRAKA